MHNAITFQPISYKDVPLMHRWFNLPHVQAFYSLRTWSEEEVLAKLKPILEKKKPLLGFLVFVDEKPIGYVQYYRVLDFPWTDQDIDDEIVKSAVGLDMFIGEPSVIFKGVGSKIIESFLEQIIWPDFSYCFVDPDERNKASVRMFEKSGFQFYKNIETEDALKKAVTLTLMKIKRPF